MLYKFDHSLFYLSLRHRLLHVAANNFVLQQRPTVLGPKSGRHISSADSFRFVFLTEGSSHSGWQMVTALTPGWVWGRVKSHTWLRAFGWTDKKMEEATSNYEEERERDCRPVWPDLAMFRHFGKTLKYFESLRTIWHTFEQVLLQIWSTLGKFSLLQMAKYWKII